MLTTTQNHGAVRVLAFNRPEALNAFNGAMFDAVAAEVLAATDDDSVKVLVITGEGRAFSAGMDLADRPDQATPPEHGFDGSPTQARVLSSASRQTRHRSALGVSACYAVLWSASKAASRASEMFSRGSHLISGQAPANLGRCRAISGDLASESFSRATRGVVVFDS